MKTLIKENDVFIVAKKLSKLDMNIRLLAVDYKWTETEGQDFFSIYVLANSEKIDKVQLVGSLDGEMWDLERSFEEKLRFEDNGKEYGIFKLELYDKESFPRSFVVKGVGEKEYYDNNSSRNYVIKKGRGGNIIPKKKKIILLNSIELYSLFDKM